MTALAHAISVALLHFVWQGVVVAVGLWIALAIVGNRSARLRYALSCAALLVASALPVFTACYVYRAPRQLGAFVSPAAVTGDTAALTALTSIELLPGWIAALEAWALPVWSTSVLILALRLLWSSWLVSRLRRVGRPAARDLSESVSRLAQRLGIAQPVHVLVTQLADCPSVVGWLRPVILVPAASLLNLSADQLEAVLAHELAHVRRYDYLANLLQRVVETLLFYQPAVWWISTRIRTERELCCDDVAVELCGDPVGYARALVQLERTRLSAPELALSSTAGPVLFRVQRLVGAAAPHPTSHLPANATAALLVICLLTAVHWARAQRQAGAEAKISRDAIWVDTVKFGEFPVMVRGLGAITGPDTAELHVPSPMGDLVQIGQPASVELDHGITASATVARIESKTGNETVPVFIRFEAPLKQPVGHAVDGTIRIKLVKDAIYVGRPAAPMTATEAWLFKLDPDRKSATRVKVRFGAVSATGLQVLDGLQPGDRVILSDTTKYDGYMRLRLE